MPTTSTAINACNAAILMAGPTGTMYDISGSSNEFTLDMNKDLGEFKVFGDAWRYRLECGKDATLSLTAVYTRAVNEALDLLRDWFFSGSGARFIQLNLPSNEVAADRYEGYFMLESLSIPGTSDEAAPIMVAASLRPNGAVTYSTVVT